MNSLRTIKLKQIDNSEFEIQVPHNIKIVDMRQIIALKSGIPANQQRLIYKAKLLKDEDKLTDYVNEDGETLHLIKKPPTAAEPTPQQPA